MKSQKIWSVFLLIALSFSISHDTAFNLLHDDACVATEYKVELEADHQLGDIHDHYHVNYILPTPFTLAVQTYKETQPLFNFKNYLFKASKDLLRPPTFV